MGCHFLLQRIFPTRGSNPGLPHCRQTLHHLSHQGSPCQGLSYILNSNNGGLCDAATPPPPSPYVCDWPHKCSFSSLLEVCELLEARPHPVPAPLNSMTQPCTRRELCVSGPLSCPTPGPLPSTWSVSPRPLGTCSLGRPSPPQLVEGLCVLLLAWFPVYPCHGQNVPCWSCLQMVGGL